MTAAVRRYGVRRVNPFDGVLQVIETAQGRAYSPNGETWQVQVFAERPGHTWRSVGHAPPVMQYFNFGIWDRVNGLHRVPANPVMDIGAMSAAAGDVCNALDELADRLPFPLVDRFECWAVDDAGAPVVLLATTGDRAMVERIRVDRWLAAPVGDDRFESRTLAARGIPNRGGVDARRHAGILEQRVRDAAPRHHWFERLTDGSGESLAADGDGLGDGPGTARDFPSLGLRRDWTADEDRELVADYIDWLAPRLLMLQHLDDAERAALERAACLRAEQLADGFRLLPRILDTAALEAARVEARLRRSAR